LEKHGETEEEERDKTPTEREKGRSKRGEARVSPPPQKKRNFCIRGGRPKRKEILENRRRSKGLQKKNKDRRFVHVKANP